MTEEHPPSSRKYRPPTPEPVFLRALAYANFGIAAVCLTFHVFNGAVENSKADRRFEKALESVENPRTQAMRKELTRALDIKDGMRADLAARLPMSRWHGQLDQCAEFVTSMLLIVGGVGLLRRQPSARAVCLTYAGISVALKLFNFAYLHWFEAPISRTYLEMMIRMYPADTRLIMGILDPIAAGAFHQLLFAAYPVLIAVVMLRPDTVRQLVPPEVTATPADGEVAVNAVRESAWNSFDNPTF